MWYVGLLWQWGVWSDSVCLLYYGGKARVSRKMNNILTSDIRIDGLRLSDLVHKFRVGTVRRSYILLAETSLRNLYNQEILCFLWNPNRPAPNGGRGLPGCSPPMKIKKKNVFVDRMTSNVLCDLLFRRKQPRKSAADWLYSWHYFYNIVFNFKHKLYVTSGSIPHPMNYSECAPEP